MSFTSTTAKTADARSLDKQTLDKQLARQLLPHWRLLLLAAVCAVGVSLAALAVGVLLKHVLDALTSKHKTLLSWWILGFILLYAIRWPLLWGQSVLFAEAGQRVGQNLRNRIYAHLQQLSLTYFDNQRTGNLISTFSNDVPLIQSGIMSLKDVVGAPVLAIVGLVYAFQLSHQLFAVTIVLLPIMAWLIHIITKTIRGISRDTQNRLADMTTVTEETLAGTRLVRAFGAEQREEQRFASNVQAAKNLTMLGIKRAGLLAPTVDLLGAVGIAIALYVGGNEVIKGTLTFGSLGMFCVMLDKVRVGIGAFGGIQVSWRQTLGAAERIFGGILEVPPAVVDAPGAQPLRLTQGEIEFSHISFGYLENQIVLDNLTFTMRPGEVTAVVGPSGAGKSTLADLIPRFYDASSGSIAIDGQNTRQVTVKSLRDEIAIVPQDTLLFGGTVRDNIAYGKPDASTLEVETAARAANAHEFIQNLKEGYGTIVGERGVMLSGGQRQRIAIARAILKNPRILILDEATSSLDETSQVLVQEALEKLMDGRTTLVIAHRLSTIKNANKIVVLRAGRIVESGSHSELISAGGEYAGLYETQFRSSDIIQPAIAHVA